MTFSRIQRGCIPVILAAAAPAAPAQGNPQLLEYQAKAAVLRAVGNYTHWPEGRGAKRGFTIGILGSSPFGRHLDDQVRDQRIRGAAINLLSLRTLDPARIRDCDMLFICESESERLAEILESCKGLPILTVGDTQGFARRGVMLNFTFGAQRLGLEANLGAIRAAGLEVSSSFLTLAKARIVEPS